MDASSSGQKQAPAPRSFRDSLLAMIGIGLVNMLVALDQTVVSTALPSILSDLKGFEYYAWMASAYLLASVVTVPVFGRLGDFFGRKPFVVAAIIVFTLASLLCACAPNMLTLVLARGLQGVGGGMMVGTAFASIPDLFPDPRARVRWQVVMAAAYGIGTAAGPSLGGFLSEHYGWRSTFFINLPVGAAGLYCVVRYLPLFRRHAGGTVRIDWLGAVLIAVALGGLQLCVENLPRRGLDGGNLMMLGIVALSSVGLYLCERRVEHPILPLGLFANRRLALLFTLSLIAGFAMFSLIFFTPLLLQGGFGLSPQQAGLLSTPLPVCLAVGSLLNTRIVVRLERPASILTTGFVLMLLACAGVGLTGQGTPHAMLVAALACGGVGLGFVLNNMNIFGQEIGGKAHFGIVTALMQSTRMVGGMFGTAAVGTLVAHHYAAGAAQLMAAADPAGRHPEWLARLSDPQVLVDASARGSLMADMARAPVDAAVLISASREQLVSAIHAGLWMTGVAVVLAIVLMRRIADVRLSQSPPPAGHAPE
jgi:EmrB/QacA subfamily drug resistance transporter